MSVFAHNVWIGSGAQSFTYVFIIHMYQRAKKRVSGVILPINIQPLFNIASKKPFYMLSSNGDCQDKISYRRLSVFSARTRAR